MASADTVWCFLYILSGTDPYTATQSVLSAAAANSASGPFASIAADVNSISILSNNLSLITIYLPNENAGLRLNTVIRIAGRSVQPFSAWNFYYFRRI